MHKRVAAGATFDLPQTDKIAAFEVAITMLEFPKGGVGIAGMENITLCPSIRQGPISFIMS